MAWTSEQKRAIYESGQNIIVSAGAGSGKTAVLTARVIDKINNGIHINELLVLTFTKAAAFEMKDRIRKELLKDDKYIEELKLINSSYITTFDSYALSIVKKYHYLLNLPSNISISNESVIKMHEKEIIDKIFEDYYKEKDEDFLYLIDSYCTRNDRLIKENILKICNSLNNKINSKEYINNIKNNFFSDDSIKRIYNDYLKLLEEKRKELEVHLKNMSYIDNETYDNFCNDLNGILNCEAKDIHLYESTALSRLKNGSSDDVKQNKERINKSLKELINISHYKGLDNVKEIILSNKRNIISIINIVEKYIDELNNYKKLNNIYTFSDIAALSIKILKENESVREETKNSFKEIMIDEYQDTNDIQEEFISLISNNNVYMVGDIKQSIYKFRDSNPNIFKSKYDAYSSNENGIKIDLIKNFRSRKEVINCINDIFRLLMDDFIGDARYKESHEMVYGLENYNQERMDDFNYNTRIVEYNPDENYSNNEIEMFIIANDIKNKIDNNIQVYDKKSNTLRDANYSDFVIILDRSKFFDEYKKVFEYMGIPFTILKDENLTNNSDLLIVKNLIELLLKINNQEYDVSFKYDFVSIARSFLYEYTDNQILDIIKNDKYKETNLFKDLCSIESINSKSISDILIEVLNVVDYYNKINKVGNLNSTNIRLRTIYNISEDLNNNGYDIYDFIEYLNDIIETGIDIKYKTFASNANSVKIMTIHGSKGLEYPFCYFADLDHKFNDSDIKEKFILTDNYGLIVYDEDNNILKDLYKYEYMKSEISERLRLFYVALTRAREQAIIVLPYSENDKLPLNESGLIDDVYRIKYNKLSDFVTSIKSYLNDYYSLIDIKDINISKDYLYTKNKKITDIEYDKDIDVEEISVNSSVLNIKEFSKEKIDTIDNEEYNLLKVGTKVHSILEYIDFNNYDESLIEDSFIKNKINSFMKNEILKDIKSANIYKEYEFKYTKDDSIYNGVIDLMIEHDDYIDIIDYKLKNISDDKYKDQLYGYKQYIESVNNKKVNVYLYSILDEKLVRL